MVARPLPTRKRPVPRPRPRPPPEPPRRRGRRGARRRAPGSRRSSRAPRAADGRPGAGRWVRRQRLLRLPRVRREDEEVLGGDPRRRLVVADDVHRRHPLAIDDGREKFPRDRRAPHAAEDDAARSLGRDALQGRRGEGGTAAKLVGQSLDPIAHPRGVEPRDHLETGRRRAALGRSLGAALGHSLGGALGHSLGAALGRSLGGALLRPFGAHARKCSANRRCMNSVTTARTSAGVASPRQVSARAAASPASQAWRIVLISGTR
jgi:hypothetical protein